MEVVVTPLRRGCQGVGDMGDRVAASGDEVFGHWQTQRVAIAARVERAALDLELSQRNKAFQIPVYGSLADFALSRQRLYAGVALPSFEVLVMRQRHEQQSLTAN